MGEDGNPEVYASDLYTGPAIREAKEGWWARFWRHRKEGNIFGRFLYSTANGLNVWARGPFYGRGDYLPTLDGQGVIKGSSEAQMAHLDGFTTVMGTVIGGGLSALKSGAAIEKSGSAIEKASEAAFNAAGDVESIFIKSKHLDMGAGRFAKFNTSDIGEARRIVQEGLRAPNALFLPNPNLSNTFRVQTNLGKVIGTRGQTSVRVIVGFDGKVINAFPIK